VSSELLHRAQRVVGMRATERALKKGVVERVFIALDVEEILRKRIETLAKEKGVPIEYVPKAQELGRMCGIEVSSSCAAILKNVRTREEEDADG